jgi:hypothetical protein
MSTTQLLAPVLLFASAGMLLLMHARGRLRRRRLLSASGSGVTGLGLLVVAGLIAAIGVNLHTYQRLTHERDVATLSFEALAPERFEVTITYPENGPARRYELRGDEWQLDARVLKWRGGATLLGLDTLYRVERLSGRYHEVAREREAPRSVFSLAPQAGLDLWSMARRYETWLPWVDATYGSATYLPMANEARFQVRLTQSGLVARPLNPAAEHAVAGWR